MFRTLKEDPNHIYVMGNNNGGKSSNNDKNSRLYTCVVVLAFVLLFIHTLSPSFDDSSPSNNASNLRYSSSDNAISNRFSYSKTKSPYEEIWINSKLPGWAKKKRSFRSIEDSVAPSERICYVHVGKTGGSTVGCGLGFSLHCNNHTQPPLGGLLPQRATRMFHADTYDCHDDSAYFLFVARDPVERLKSAFLYERPKGTGRKGDAWLKKHSPQQADYERKKNLYLDCPRFGVMENFVQDGLTKHGRASEECKFRAFTAVRGERHFNCHMYFNYQFHLEGVPEDANVLAIRNEHLVRDWNAAEHFIGGEKDMIPPERANETIHAVNKSTKDGQDKWLSDESTRIVCRQLCNEIVAYKKILRRALNLNYLEVERSTEELREVCPEYADREEGECPTPMPDISTKLMSSRGYEDIVMETSYHLNKEILETTMHRAKKGDEAEAEELMDDDAYDLPYNV
mmetsp:Transcript_32863/g.79529  ORF Transcript_32863/g.79529 Transcript_32863/m.79529 type:complete len:456 (-) Transcript_32863:32-1399(-)